MKDIPLTRGKVALVDDEDYERVNQFRWAAHKRGNTWYAYRNAPSFVRMHKFILAGHPEIDHANGNGLDNQKRNLRPATRSQNTANGQKHVDGLTSRFRGVSFSKESKRWVAYIGVSGHHFNLGYYDSEDDAAISYNHAAIAYFGEFARLNLVV